MCTSGPLLYQFENTVVVGLFHLHLPSGLLSFMKIIGLMSDLSLFPASDAGKEWSSVSESVKIYMAVSDNNNSLNMKEMCLSYLV